MGVGILGKHCRCCLTRPCAQVPRVPHTIPGDQGEDLDLRVPLTSDLIADAVQEEPRIASYAASMVRRSVANNLNDLGKVRPDLSIGTCAVWLENASDARRALVDGLGRHPVLDQGHVYGPVRPARLAELAGAVERVDDPDPPGIQPRVVDAPFLRQDRVVRPQLREPGERRNISYPDAGIPDRFAEQQSGAIERLLDAGVIPGIDESCLDAVAGKRLR